MAVTAAEATKVAQVILRQVDSTLVPDGWWGSYSDAAYRKAGSGLQSAVRESLKTAGLTPEGLLIKTRAAKAEANALGDGWIPQDKAFALVDRNAADFGVSSDRIRAFLLLEAAKMMRGGVTYYNANSVSPNGLFKGLFQMGRPAWQDVQKADKSFPGYDKVMDPTWNTRAAAKYMSLNMAYAKKKGYKGEFTGEVLYAMHNQGAAGFMKLLEQKRSNSSFTNQSTPAQNVIKTALRQNGVTFA